MRSIPRSARWLAWLLLCALPAAAQPDAVERGAAPLPPTFGEIIDVRALNLEVVVTDGRDRVAGLTSDDFRVLVDGEEVPIEYFTEVSGGRAVSPAADADGAIPALAPGEPVGTRFLVFIDEVFAVQHHRNRVLRKLVRQLPEMGPDDHMAVVAYDGRQIDLLTSWTSSQRELERVFENARGRSSYGLQRRVTPRWADLDSGGPLLGAWTDRHFADTPLYDDYGRGRSRNPFGPRGSRVFSDVERVLDAATSTLRAFARPPGRKVMLLLSGGWPVGGGGRFQSALGYGAWGRADSLMRPLADTANRLGYTLYPVDLKGLEHHFGGAEHGSIRDASAAASSALARDWSEDASLLYLADETGGRAMINGISGQALQRAVEDTRSYYWLGFTPTWEENDRRHRVKVEVARKGFRVRSRESFSDLSRQTEVTMMLESAQLFDLPLPGETADLSVTFGEPVEGGFRKVIVPLQIELPLDQLTLLPYEGGVASRLELRIAATDDRGSTSAIPVIPLELTNPKTGDGATAYFELSMKLRRRPHEFLVSLHDPASGNLMSKRVGWNL